MRYFLRQSRSNLSRSISSDQSPSYNKYPMPSPIEEQVFLARQIVVQTWAIQLHCTRVPPPMSNVYPAKWMKIFAQTDIVVQTWAIQLRRSTIPFRINTAYLIPSPTDEDVCSDRQIVIQTWAVQLHRTRVSLKNTRYSPRSMQIFAHTGIDSRSNLRRCFFGGESFF